MKRITFMLIAVFAMLVSYAAGPQKRMLVGQMLPTATQLQLGQKFDAKKAPKQLAKKQLAKVRALKKAVAAADFVSDYQWDYEQAKEYSTDLESLETTSGSSRVTIAESAATEGGITISGMFSNDLEATIESDENGDYFVIEGGSQTAGTSSYGDYTIQGLFYYEGDDENDAGWYYGDIYGYLLEDGTIAIYPWICRVLTTGDYAGYSLTPYWVEGSTLTPAEPLTVVEAPKDLVTEEYAVSARNYSDNADVSGSVFIGFDGKDVYVQGLSTLLPDAWVKGTLDDTTITFATGQYFGNYADTYDVFLNVLMGEDVVFEYDEKEGTLTAKNEFFLVDNSSYYFDSYRGCVLKKVVEKAATPANPEITSMKNGNYGWYFDFNVPTVDVDGNGLVSSKLSYMIYSDIEGEIAPLTFTPETHSRLEEAMTEIPYGFTENYDFYNGTIYLNELYSADWNNLGIKSIYRGGGEVNETEIQWFHIKDYYVPPTPDGDFTFDFNKMNVPVSYDKATGKSTDGDILEDKSITEGSVTLTISPKDESVSSTENRFWETTAGPQLRMYSGTMTFEVPEGLNMTNIAFNYNTTFWGGKNNARDVTADSGTLTDDATNKVATWTGEAQKVVITIGANTQLNSIVVTVTGGEGPGPVDPTEAIDPDGLTYDFEDGTLQGWTTIDADGDGYNWKSTAENSGLNAFNGSNYAVYSQSYDKSAGALKPDNFLVSPKLKLGTKLSFYSVAQDASYPAEHFGVFVSTKGNTSAEDFEKVEEWTLTASRVDKAKMNARGVFRSPQKVQGKWYQYTVDLSAYEGQEGYVAIRHFDCTDMFYMLVDDISFGEPAYIITPAEGKVESLSDFEIKFNKYTVTVDEDAKATLTNETTGDAQTAELSLEDNTLYIEFDEVDEPGEYTLVVEGVKKETGEPVELEFAYTIEVPDVLVELPEGVTPMEYTFQATGSTSQGSVSIEETKLVAFDGTDVYLQGLAYYFPDAYVKGTLTEDNQVVVPNGQYVGEDEYGPEYIVALGVDEENYFIDADAFVFDYDAETGVLTLAEGTYYGESNSKTSDDLFIYFYEATYTPGAMELPDPVVVPEDLVAETWYLTCDSYNGHIRGQELQVGITSDFSKVYVQGLCEYLPEAWVMGTIDPENFTATFESGQFYGTYEDEYNLFFVGYDEETEEIADVVATIDLETGVITTDQMILLNGKQNAIDYYDYYYDVVITKEMPEVIEVPEDLVTEPYLFKAMAIEAGSDEEEATEAEDYQAQVQVGFYENDLYIQGISEDNPEFWVKATKNEAGQYVIPANQYMGTYEFWGYTFDYFFTAVDESGEFQDVVLNYDAETATFTTSQTLVLNGSEKELDPYLTYTDVVITKMNDVAATPADPSIEGYKFEGTTYPYISFNIPAKDVDGNDLLTSKLFYTVWIEDGNDGIEKPFVVLADEYSEIEDDLTEIPYDWDDSYDIYKGGTRFYINPTNVIGNWTKFGIQSIYYGGGERNMSNIIWLENPVYTAITNVNFNNEKAVIFDMQGRRVANPVKGLYIVNGKKAVLK